MKSARHDLRLLVIACLLPSLAQAQPHERAEPRVYLGALAYGGPGLLVGPSLSVELIQRERFRLSLDGALLVNLLSNPETPPCPPRPAICPVSARPPRAHELQTVALRLESPLAGPWKVSASLGAAGHPRGSASSSCGSSRPTPFRTSRRAVSSPGDSASDLTTAIGW